MVIDTNSRDIAWIYYVGKLFHVDIVRSVPRSTDKIHVYLMQPSLPSPLLPSRNRIIAKSDARRGSNLTREYIKITRMAEVKTFKTDFSLLKEREREETKVYLKDSLKVIRGHALWIFRFSPFNARHAKNDSNYGTRGGEEKKKGKKYMEVLQNWTDECYNALAKINSNENFNFVALPTDS